MILKLSPGRSWSRIVIMASFNCWSLRPLIEPLVSSTNMMFFSAGSKPSGAKKWTKYPSTTYGQENDLTLNAVIYSGRKGKHIFWFSIIFQRWNGQVVQIFPRGRQWPSYPTRSINTMAVDGLATSGARASSVIVLTKSYWNIPASVLGRIVNITRAHGPNIIADILLKISPSTFLSITSFAF